MAKPINLLTLDNNYKYPATTKAIERFLANLLTIFKFAALPISNKSVEFFASHEQITDGLSSPFVYNKETGESQNWVSHEMMRSTQFRNCTEILELSRGAVRSFFFLCQYGDFFLHFGRKKLLSLTFILSVGYGPVTFSESIT